MDKSIYNKYKGKVTCAYREDVYIDAQDNPRIKAKRTQEREKYIFQGFGNRRDPILIECPHDVLVLEFEGDRIVNEAMIKVVELNLKKSKLDYCVVDHRGTSPYIYIWNLKNLPEGHEAEAKKHIAKKLIPPLDFSNLGKTLIPIIGLPHWKPKYNGAVHKIIRGKDPELHHNPVDKLLEDFVKPAPKKTTETDRECMDIKSSIRLSDVLQKYGMDITQNPVKCLWHDSKGGRCFSFDDSKGVWHCFHCDRSGNVFHFIMIEEQCDFLAAKKKAADFVGIELQSFIQV